MKLYAELPGRRVRQIVADLAVLGWGCLWGWLAYLLHGAIDSLAEVPRDLGREGARFRDALAGAADEARGIPLIGDKFGRRLSEAAGVAQSAVDAGQRGEETIAKVALVAALVVVLALVLPVVVAWLWWRVRWVIRARAAIRLRATASGLDILALRALSDAALRQLLGLVDPAGGWRSGNPAAVTALARLELTALGLRGP